MPQSMRRSPASGDDAGRELEVLSLVTTAEIPFYRHQVAALEGVGVTARTLAVPGTHHRDDERATSRSIGAYLRYVPTVLWESLGEYDLVHANYGLTGPAAIAQPKPVVLSLWGSDLYGRYGAVSRWCARLADAVIVMSEAMAAAVPADCEVIPHGVDFGLFRPISQSRARADLGWTPDGLHVLFPYASTRPEKDFPRAERVVAAASERLGRPIELHTISGVAHETMPVYMNAADALVMTSRHEGSPNAVKEALACNLPVVSTAVGDVPERLAGVDPGGVGRTDAELIATLASVLASGRRSDGREQSPALGTERMAARIREVYESVCS